MKKRVLSFLLAVALLCTMLPQITFEAKAAESSWLWPAPDCYIVSSNFGWRDYAPSPYHTGIDIVGASGTKGKPVVASKSGMVYSYCNSFGDEEKYSGDDMRSYGNYVIIKHDDGKYTIYAHLKKSGVKTSGTVKQGDVIGYIGNSGSSSDWHLHFQIFTNPSNLSSSSLNPMPTNTNITIRNKYVLPDGWASQKQTYIFKPENSKHVKESLPCYGEIEITSNTSWVKSMPCSEKTDAESANVEGEAAVKGATYEAIGLILNDVGNLWYKVNAKNGKTGYIYAGDTKFQKGMDMDVDGAGLPVELKHESSYPVAGVVTAKYSCLSMVKVAVKSNADGSYPSYAQAQATTSASSYDLSDPDIDYNIKFDKLPVGKYTYYIIAKNRTSYAKSAQEVAYVESDEVILYQSTFAVVTSTGVTTTYTLTLVPNGGTCDTTTKSVIANQPIGTLPSADGFDLELNFEGWYTQPYGGKQITEETIATGNMKLYAHYSYSAVKLNFDLKGGYLPGMVLVDTVDGVNIGRPGESLVIFNESGTKPGTNIYGVEIAVNAQGKITAVRKYGDETQLTVPSGGFVLSGQMGWDADAGANVGGGLFVGQIVDMGEAYVSFNYETGEVKAFESYAAYLVETKYGREWTTLGVLPVPTRDGYMFEGWRNESGSLVDYYSGFSGINLTASWTDENTQYPDATMEYGGHYYELFDNNVTWTEAKRICEERGGYLVVITSAAEQSAIVGMLSNGSRGMYRIGATDADTEGKWKWVNGETFSYSNWDPNYPEPSATEGENYANIIAIENAPNKQVGEWVDDMDTSYSGFYDISNTGFVCEYDQKICKHKYTAKTIAATCTVVGYTEYTCGECGDTYRTEIPSLGHNMEYISGVEATCTETGLTAGTACDRCGEIGTAQTEVAALGHSFVNYVSDGNATCTADGTKTAKCERCNVTDTVTDTGSKLGHDYSVVVSTTEPDCAQQGSTVKKCSRCDSMKTTYTDALGHNMVTVPAVAPSCTATGLTAGTVCDRCGEIGTAQIEVPATGHNYVNGVCSGCGSGSTIFTYVIDNGEVTITDCDTSVTGTITIPAVLDGYPVTAIGDEAFRYCDDLQNVIIPNGINSVGSSAFFGCTSLISVTLPDSITNLGDRAFMRCTGLQSVIVGNGITVIDENTFAYCDALRHATLGDNVSVVGKSAFQGCINLESMVLPASITGIEEYAFQNCKSLTGIWVAEDNAHYSSDPFGVLFDKNKTRLIRAPGKISGSYIIPNSVTVIESMAFEDCDSLSSVTIQDGVKSIGSLAFKDCSGLINVTIADSVDTIGSCAFYYCNNLQSVVMGNGVSTIYSQAFYGCKALLDVYYNGSQQQWNAINLIAGNECLTNATLHCHTHSYTSATVGATCTTAGYTEYTCACGDSYREEIPAKGHDYTTDPAVCGTCGHVRASSEITSVVLKPASAGIYFKGSFTVDADVQVVRQGIAVSTENALPVADDSDPSSLYTTSGVSVLVKDILKTDNTDGQNRKNATMLIYARTYILLDDGTYIYGETVVVNLKSLVEAIDAKLDNLTGRQAVALTRLYTTYATIMESFNLPNLKEYAGY